MPALFPRFLRWLAQHDDHEWNAADACHLLFVRYLVQRGRLSDR